MTKIYVKTSGVQQPIQKMYVKTGGVWQLIQKVYIKDNTGSWRQVFGS